MAGYNRTRYVEQLLEKTEDAPPSFMVHLHAEYWILNNGSKFLYHNPIASLLDDIRAHRIPVDFLEFFDSARVPFYEGCMIVELLDYRPPRSTEPALRNPSKTRVVLHPSPETLWADICSLNQHMGGKWTDMDALEVESKLLLATSQPLCLDPDPHLTRVVNNVLRVSTPNMPLSLKRKSSAMEPEEDGPEKARRERLLGFMAPRDNRAHAPSYRLLDAIHAGKQKMEATLATGTAQPSTAYMPQPIQPSQPTNQPTPQPTPTPSTPVPPAHSPVPSGDIKSAVQRNGSRTPAPTPPTQFVIPQVAAPSATPTQAPMMPPVYTTLHPAAKDAPANRALTPAQQLQMQKQIQEYHQQYMQQFHQQHTQQQEHAQQMATQHLSPPSQPSQQLPRPPSQPQHLQPSHTRASPQLPTQQLNATQPPPQRFSQTPKPPQIQPSTSQTSQPNGTQQPYPGTIPNFPGQPHPLGAPPTHMYYQTQQTYARQAQQRGASAQQLNAAPIGQQPVNVQQPSQQQPQPHQLTPQQQQQIMQQRMAASSAAGGRTTPAQVQQSPRSQTQALQQVRAISSTPSPMKGSPIVNQQQLAAAHQVRASPMPSKATIPIQASTSGQGHPVNIAPQGQQQPGGGQNHPNHPGGMQMPPQRIQFQPAYIPAQNRSQANGNQMPAGNTIHGTPTIPHASIHMSGAAVRPITPAQPSGMGPDGKPLQPNGQLQVPPHRRPTPLQQHQAAQIAQLQAAHQQAKQNQTPLVQPQQLPGGPGAAQGQRAPTPVGQVHQPPVQQAAQIPGGGIPQQSQPQGQLSLQQAQQIAAYAQACNMTPTQMQHHLYRMAQQGQGHAVGQVQNPAMMAALQHQQTANVQHSQAAMQQYQQLRQQEHQQQIQASTHLRSQEQVQHYLQQQTLQQQQSTMGDPRAQGLAQTHLMAATQGGHSSGGVVGNPTFQHEVKTTPQLTQDQRRQQLMMGKMQMAPTAMHQQQQQQMIQQQQALAAQQQAMAHNAMMGGAQAGGSGMGGPAPTMAQLQKMQIAMAQKAKAAGAAGMGGMMGGKGVNVKGAGPR